MEVLCENGLGHNNSESNGCSSSPVEATAECKKEYANLLNIPKDIIFPLELSIHLKERLQLALEEIFRLKKQIFNQDHEISSLHLKAEKSKSDKYFETKEYKQKMAMTANPQMATKVVELCKKNRDMTAEIESMRTRMKQLMAENDSLKEEKRNWEENFESSNNEKIGATAVKSEEEILSTAQQLANATNKMMDYRRQCQQTRLELRTALKALSQEVGDGATPQTVLSTIVNNGSWRGRQQQILTLQQKVNELQAKLTAVQQLQQQLPSQHRGGGEPENMCDVESCVSGSLIPPSESNSMLLLDEKSTSVRSAANSWTSSLPISAAQRRLLGLQQQEKNKFEQLEKTSQMLEDTRKELKEAQQGLKGYKARCRTLEEQVRTSRAQIETLESKLGAKQVELQEALDDRDNIKQEFGTMKDRMRTIRDKATAEIMEAQQVLNKERSNNAKLQKIVESYQIQIDSFNLEIKELQLSLNAYERSPTDNLEARKRLQYLEMHFDEMKQAMIASDCECRRLLELMESAVSRVEDERTTRGNAQRHLLKSFAVLDSGDQCISVCLEAGQISDKKVLETVEEFRSMVRELKTGDLYHLAPIPVSDVRKLKSRVSILNKEILVLQRNLKQSAVERKNDLKNFAAMVDKIIASRKSLVDKIDRNSINYHHSIRSNSNNARNDSSAFYNASSPYCESNLKDDINTSNNKSADDN